VSLYGLLDALSAAVAGIVPATAPGLAFTLVEFPSEGELLQESDRVPSRAVYVQEGAPIDTGLVSGDPIDEASYGITIAVLYREADFAGAAYRAAVEDAVNIISTIRPQAVWASQANDVAVYPDTQVEDIGDVDRVTGRILRVRMTARVSV
jgi:hypothetical protein